MYFVKSYIADHFVLTAVLNVFWLGLLCLIASHYGCSATDLSQDCKESAGLLVQPYKQACANGVAFLGREDRRVSGP